ncbi:YncE family protein [Thalassomonas sp. RHCl1]|uniref:YncE family protein n=1 Tax=Thalassomonas sp. RHCl1 TaxID=2995320 RepID=UPI00248D01A9|nr:YncE family protein [Thalassomonas sp. RHCl1]
MSKLLFSTDTDSGTITVLDPTASMKTVCKIAVGNGPRGPVKFTTTGRGFVANHAGNTLSEIDAYSLRELSRIKVGNAPIGVAIVPGDRYALTSCSGDNNIAVIDLDSREVVHSLVTGREPRHMDITPCGKYAYAAVSGGDYISKINVEALSQNNKKNISDTVREEKRIFLGEGTMPYSFAINSTGEYGLAANNQTEYVSIVDLKNDKVFKEVKVGNKGARGSVFSPDGDKVFVTIEDINEILAIDVSTGNIDNRFPVGPGPRGIILDEQTNTLFASAFARNKAVSTSAITKPNSVSIVELGSVTTLKALSSATPSFKEVSVGAGPCSVNIFTR